MLKPSMSCTWIDQIGHRQLMDMTQPLKRSRIEYRPLIRREPDEYMQRITNLDDATPRHESILLNRVTALRLPSLIIAAHAECLLWFGRRMCRPNGVAHAQPRNKPHAAWFVETHDESAGVLAHERGRTATP